MDARSLANSQKGWARSMSRSICFVFLAFVSACFSSVVAFDQAASSQIDSNAAPVAFVYVTSPTSTSSYEINAYAASANGVLTAVPGSPFAAVAFLNGYGQHRFVRDWVEWGA
jgi:hypothetical protein